MVKLNSSVSRNGDIDGIAGVYSRLCALLCCSICGRQSRSPVFVCPGGHAFCMSCRPINRLQCWICQKGTFPQTLNIINKISDLLATSNDGVIFEKSLTELFECPVCYKLATSEKQYGMCLRGHLVCRFCFYMTAYCPLCRESEFLRRTRLLDLIYKEIRKGYKCSYSEYGCDEICNIFTSPRHEDVCSFRRFHCLVASCPWIGTAENIYDHGLTNHREICAKDDSVTFSKGKLQVRFGDNRSCPYWILYSYSDDGLELVVQSHVTTKIRTRAEIQLGDGKTETLVSFSHPALHIAEDPLAQLISADHLEIPGPILKKYTSSDNLTVRVSAYEKLTANESQWLNPFNIFTAAFAINFSFLLSNTGNKVGKNADTCLLQNIKNVIKI